MKTYNIDWLYNKLNLEEVEYLFFWKPEKNATVTKACLSQWTYSPFIVNDICYLTAEHWMMSKKAELFGDNEILREILSTESPAEVQILGKKVKNFDLQEWKKYQSAIVEEGNFHKFSQNEEMKSFLLATQDKVLVEASPLDRIWGIGLNEEDENANNPYLWKGTNLLGFTLMEVRDRLRNDEK